MIGIEIEYTLEIVKFYIMFRWFLGIQRRQEKWIYLFVWLILTIYSAWLVYGEGNTLLIYFIFVFAEMGLLFQERAEIIFFMSLWLWCVIRVSDSISEILAGFLFHFSGYEGFFISVYSPVITILIEILFVKILKRITGKKKINISFNYYLYFIFLGILDRWIMGCLESFETESGIGWGKYLDEVLVGLTLYIQMGIVFALAVSRDNYKKRGEINQQLLRMQEENYKTLEKRERDTKKFRHDIREHVLVMLEMCDTGKYQQLKDYLREIAGKIHISETIVTVNNKIVDSILNQYISVAGDKKVKLDIKGHLFEDCNIAPYDLCVIFSNILKNGVEAAENSQGKNIKLILRYTEDEIIICMKNDYAGALKKKNGKYVTIKKDVENHGIGMENIMESVEKYGGTLDFTEEQGEFVTIICIPKEKSDV